MAKIAAKNSRSNANATPQEKPANTQIPISSGSRRSVMPIVPNPLGLSRHRRSIWVSAGPVGRAQPLRDDPLKAYLAGVAKDHIALWVATPECQDSQGPPARPSLICRDSAFLVSRRRV